MKKTSTTPWHEVVTLRDDVRTGELTLATFAADLHDVALGRGRRVYQEPGEFFALTFPTYNLRELCKDVVLRLAGKNDKAVRQLELTYGGGKTHTLITLYHLVREPSKLPKLPAVQQFFEHIGLMPPKARVGILAFDKLDAEKGMEVRGPSGKIRWLKHPWSVLAFNLADAEGLRMLHPDGEDKERDSAPAEPLLVQLLSVPQKNGEATLVLIDEVLMFAREKVASDKAWEDKLSNFFHHLAQAATKVDRCCIVASLLATDPKKHDALGKRVLQELSAQIERVSEEAVAPVAKEDVAEVLRRRFFTPDSIRDPEAFWPHVVNAVRAIAELDEATARDRKGAEERYLRSFPFHPDLTEVLYQKWTNLEGFQRTRGVLRTFALALRSAEKWDPSPLVGPSAFLAAPGSSGLSEAAREMAGVAATEEYEGKKQEWSAIIEGELAKARDIQAELGGIKHRELEQAVFATFLHSQPVGQKASTRDVLVLVGATSPDKIEMEKALVRWAEASWFLDEDALTPPDAAGQRQLPKVWRLGSKPNLKQMHHDACQRIPPDLVEARLLDEIGRTKKLTETASSLGVKVHPLPEKPSDLDDDGELRFAILKPSAASEPGRPSREACRFIEESTRPDRPRVNRNAVILAAPSRDGLDIARQRIRDHFGWEEVRAQLKGKEIDPIRKEKLELGLAESKKAIPAAILQAYSVLVTLTDKNEIGAFRIPPGDDALFVRIRSMPQARIQETAIDAEALLPEGPYDLWQPGETSRRVSTLVGAFAQFPHLPKMLNRKAITDTIVQGCRDGRFVLRALRPDRTVKTYWRDEPTEADMKEPSLEVVLPEAATLTEVPPALLSPGVLPGLWVNSELRFSALCEYFAGGKAVKIKRDGYDESIVTPRADRSVLERAVSEAVHAGRLWLISGAASVLGEPIGPGLITEDARVLPPPPPIPASDLLPSAVPEAWKDKRASAAAIASALSSKAGRPLPWTLISAAIDSAVRSRLLEPAPESTAWPCDVGSARSVVFQVPERVSGAPVQTAMPPAGTKAAEAELRINELQELTERLDDLRRAAAGHELRFTLRIEVGGAKPVAEDVARRLNALLAEIAPKLQIR